MSILNMQAGSERFTGCLPRGGLTMGLMEEPSQMDGGGISLFADLKSVSRWMLGSSG